MICRRSKGKWRKRERERGKIKRYKGNKRETKKKRHTSHRRGAG